MNKSKKNLIKYTIITFLLLLTTIVGYSQENKVPILGKGMVIVKNGTLSFRSNYTNNQTYYNFRHDEEIDLNQEIVGTPYLDDNFIAGTIFVNDTLTFPGIKMKYNAYYDLFEVAPSIENPDEEPSYVDKDAARQIKLGNTIFVALPNPKNPSELQYYQFLTGGKSLRLLKLHQKILSDRIQAPTSMTRDVPAMYKDHSELYFLDSEGVLYLIPNNKKEILWFMKDKKEAIEKVIQESHLNLKEETDLLKLVRYYNTL